MIELEQSNRFLIQQVFKPISNEYRISIPTPGATDEGRPILFVKQKKMKIKEDIRFRTSEDGDAYAFMIKAKSVFEFRGRHEVLDADGQVDRTAREGVRRVTVPQPLAREGRRTAASCSRRTSRVGSLRSSAASPTSASTGCRCSRGCRSTSRSGGTASEVGSYKRVLGKFRDRYVLELGEGLVDADRRLVVAFAVALDALQDR